MLGITILKSSSKRRHVIDSYELRREHTLYVNWCSDFFDLNNEVRVSEKTRKDEEE